MTWRSDRLIESYDLPEIEAAYLHEVDVEARGLTGTTRRRFVRLVGEILVERPTSTTRESLDKELGPADELVRQFRNDEALPPRASLWRRWWDLAPVLRFAHVLVVAAVTLGLLWLRGYYGAVPEFAIPCGGMVASEHESRQAAGRSEFVAIARPGERIGFQLCPYPTTAGTTLTRVSFPGSARSPVQPVGWEVNQEQGAITLEGDASNGTEISFHLVQQSGWRNAVVWFEVEACLPVGGVSFDEVVVDYRYRGRDRSLSVPLLYTYTVQFPFDRCTDESRESYEAETAAFGEAAALSGLDPARVWEPLAPLGLYPVDVSRNLCRYLRGVRPVTNRGVEVYSAFEPLGERAVFQLDDRELAEALIDGAVIGICPEFAPRRDSLVAELDK